LVILLDLKESIPTEVEALDMVWVHFHDLVSNAHNRLILLHLVLAHNQVHEARDL